MNELGPYYIFDKETKEEIEASRADLEERNVEFYIALQIRKEELDHLNESRPKSRKRKRPDKPAVEKLERAKNLKGGVDWYRYQTKVLRPLLLPFIYTIIAKYGHCYLVQDGAASHNSWQVLKDLQIQGLTVLPWPGNSPDLNQIEPCWYWLKCYVAKMPFKEDTKEWFRKAFEQGWGEIPQKLIGRWCGRMVERMERCIAHKGKNNFHA